jgi:hypothetical protein
MRISIICPHPKENVVVLSAENVEDKNILYILRQICPAVKDFDDSSGISKMFFTVVNGKIVHPTTKKPKKRKK